MKVLYNWLKEFVPLEISAEETAATLARLGFEIASFELLGGKLRGIVTADVKEVHKHPNADRLSLCTVNDGQSDFSVVCGAPNVRAGIRVPFARVGATLPNGETLKAAQIRGIESQGMICSEGELGLAEKSDGIMILDAHLPLGADVRGLLGLDDAVIEIEVTPNRRDVLSVFGVARELAAALALSLKNLEPRVRELEIANGISLSNEVPELCPRYIARYIRDVRVGTSPDWVSQRLARCGIRSINNIVDITNYVMLELGQPLHAFDAIKLKGRHVKVRMARRGEKILTLEGKTAELREGMLVIADEDRPAALAGIMGGTDSAITTDTREIVLESAAFISSNIRQTSKALGISSESSYRFERGTDWNMVSFASRRAAQLVQELAGGLGFKPLESAVQAPVPATIKLRTERMRRFLGAEIKESAAADILRRLGCVIGTGTGQLSVTVPSWRLDLTNESDLMEEVARMHGYENIPTRAPAVHVSTAPEDPLFSFERRLANILIGFGFSEAYNYTFVNRAHVESVVPHLWESELASAVALANPLSLDQDILRRSLLPPLLQNAVLNFRRQAPGVKLFELGRVFFRDGGTPQEQRHMGLLLGGEIQSSHWRGKKHTADFYELLGLLDAFFASLQITPVQRTPLHSGTGKGFHPKKSCLLFSGSALLGGVGEIHPDVAAELDTNETLVMAELDVQTLRSLAPTVVSYKPYSPFPPVRRDLSIVAPQSIPYETILKTLQAAGRPVLESVSLIDLFQGEKIGANKKSLTVSLLFRQRNKTLSDVEVERIIQKILADLQKKCETTLRK